MFCYVIGFICINNIWLYGVRHLDKGTGTPTGTHYPLLTTSESLFLPIINWIVCNIITTATE